MAIRLVNRRAMRLVLGGLVAMLVASASIIFVAVVDQRREREAARTTYLVAVQELWELDAEKIRAATAIVFPDDPNRDVGADLTPLQRQLDIASDQLDAMRATSNSAHRDRRVGDLEKQVEELCAKRDAVYSELMRLRYYSAPELDELNHRLSEQLRRVRSAQDRLKRLTGDSCNRDVIGRAGNTA